MATASKKTTVTRSLAGSAAAPATPLQRREGFWATFGKGAALLFAGAFTALAVVYIHSHLRWDSGETTVAVMPPPWQQPAAVGDGGDATALAMFQSLCGDAEIYKDGRDLRCSSPAKVTNNKTGEVYVMPSSVALGTPASRTAVDPNIAAFMKTCQGDGGTVVDNRSKGGSLDCIGAKMPYHK